MFHPRVQSRIDGITVLGDLAWRAWPGIVADVWSVACEEGARGEYVSPHPRLFAVLEAEGGGEVGLAVSPKAARDGKFRAAAPLSFLPAGLRVWSSMPGVRRLTHLDVHFDLSVLQGRFAEVVGGGRLNAPRLGFADARIAGLVGLLAAECRRQSGALDDLYGESLALALFVALLGPEARPARERGGLAPRHLRSVVDFLEDHCLRNVRLAELTGLTGLSPSHLCHAFKASTGLSPHRWQMQARVARVKEMLKQPELPLTDVAASAGFSDQAHLTRVFRRMTGTTPAAWRRALVQ